MSLRIAALRACSKHVLDERTRELSAGGSTARLRLIVACLGGAVLLSFEGGAHKP
jgi:uncharacterized membrane protein